VSRPLDPSVLPKVLSRAKELAGRRGLVLFDLDSTLLDNRPRQARILREFGQSAGVTALAACTPEHFKGWSLKVPMGGCGLSAVEADTLEPQARRFWRERFFTSAYCHDDRPIPGAVDFVRRVLDAGSQIVYCTGRHVPMRDGTLSCFSREGFPVPEGNPRVHLLMKPVLELHDDEYKLMVRDKVLELGEVIAAFDNEPSHINTYHEHFPEALCVHLATDDSARGIVVHPDIPSIGNFLL
jgi:hypothetical protein